MPQIHANGLALEVEATGPAAAPAVVLVMGLGAPLTRWNPGLVDLLVARGFRVVRFDNRDCGRSSHCPELPVPSLRRLAEGEPPPYTLTDMAEDAVAVLDALEIPRAHFVGASLGGAIVQHVAAEHPARVLSLTSIMASSGNPALPPPTAAATASLWTPLPAERDEESIVRDTVPRLLAVASPAYPPRMTDLEAMARSEYRRGFHPAGVVRQLAAILADGDRRSLLARITAPTVVLHGAADPLVPVAHGMDTAAHIPGAELRIIPGMGHDFPAALCGEFADAIAAARA